MRGWRPVPDGSGSIVRRHIVHAASAVISEAWQCRPRPDCAGDWSFSLLGFGGGGAQGVALERLAMEEDLSHSGIMLDATDQHFSGGAHHPARTERHRRLYCFLPEGPERAGAL